MWSVPLRVTCPGPLLRLACLGGGAVRSRFPPTWLGAVGVAEGRPRGGCLPLLRGASGVRRSPSPDRPPTGRAVGVRYPRAVGAGVWVWGPNTVPLACTPFGGCVPRGWSGAVPLPGLGLCAPRGAGPWHSCAGARPGGGGGVRAPCPPFVRPGGACRAGGRSVSFGPSAFPGQATKRVSLALFWSWGAWPPISLWFVLARLHWARSVRRPGALPRARLFPAVPVGAGGWGGGAGRAPAPVSGGGRADHPPCLGGWGPGSPQLAGRWGGWGGGVAPQPPCSPSGWRPGAPYPGPPLVVGALPPGVRVRSRSRGRPGVGGLKGGPWTALPGAPPDLNPPLPSLSGQWSWGGHGGRGLHTVLVRRRAPPPGLVRALLRRAGVGSPVCRDPRESRRLGALGRTVCRSSRTPPPPRRGPFRGRGGVPSAPGGRRVAPVATSWGGGAGGGVGGPPHHPLSPRPIGCRPAICCLWRAPPGYTRAVGVAGWPRASGAAQSAANGTVRRGGGGEGGGGKAPALVCAPVFPRPASEGAALFAPSWAPPVRHPPAAGRAGACRRFTGGACRGRGVPSPQVQRPLQGGLRGRRLFGLPMFALQPEGEGGGEWRGPSGPLAPPPDGRGGAAWRSRPRGPAVGWGVALFPRPPLPRVGLSCRPSLGPLVPPRRRRAALAGRGRP